MRSIKEIILKLKERERTKLSPPLAEQQLIKKIEAAYGVKVPSELLEVYTITAGGFLEIDDLDSWLLYSPDEILCAPEELHIDFISLGKIPLIDCKDNDIICYDVKTKKYHFFNILDEATFIPADSLALLFEQRLI